MRDLKKLITEAITSTSKPISESVEPAGELISEMDPLTAGVGAAAAIGAGAFLGKHLGNITYKAYTALGGGPMNAYKRSPEGREAAETEFMMQPNDQNPLLNNYGDHRHLDHREDWPQIHGHAKFDALVHSLASAPGTEDGDGAYGIPKSHESWKHAAAIAHSVGATPHQVLHYAYDGLQAHHDNNFNISQLKGHFGNNPNQEQANRWADAVDSNPVPWELKRGDDASQHQHPKRWHETDTQDQALDAIKRGADHSFAQRHTAASKKLWGNLNDIDHTGRRHKPIDKAE